MDSLHLLLRITARISFVLFILAFAGQGLAVLLQSELARRLRHYRHHLLLGFVSSHTIHLGLVITLAVTMGWTVFLAKFTWVTVFVGGFAFLLIYALAADALAQLWPRGLPSLKERLVSFAMYFVWTIFALAYVTRIRPSDPVHAVFGVVALAGFMIRILGRRRAPAKFTAAVRS